MADPQDEHDLADVVVSYIGLISLATISIYSGSFGSLPVSLYSASYDLTFTLCRRQSDERMLRIRRKMVTVRRSQLPKKYD
jgi:hypothetical protein